MLAVRQVSVAARSGMLDGMYHRFRATGADLPFGDPLRAHGVAMEGYFWRLSDTRSGRVIVALCGVHRSATGRRWANVALASHPGGVVVSADVDDGHADPAGLGVRAGGREFIAGPGRVRLDLGPRAAFDLRLHGERPWTRRPFGGLGAAQLVPGLSQRWHPHVLGARATGTATIGDEVIDLDGFTAYAEKNWGPRGFPERWWWGQADQFGGDDACVAFAGGDVGVGPVRTTATSVVVRAGAHLVRLGDPVLSPVRTDAGDGTWRLRARGPVWSVEIDGHAAPADAHVLPVPHPASGRSVDGALQHFAGEMRVVLRRRGRVAWSGTSTLAALETGGRESVEREIARRARPVTGSPPADAGPALVPAVAVTR